MTAKKCKVRNVFYIAYWIPTIKTNIDFKNPKKPLPFRVNVSETKEKEKRQEILIDVNFDKEKPLFLIKEPTKSSEILVELEALDYQPNGLILLEVRRLKQRFSSCTFWTDSFYHVFKELYHNHDFHLNEEDAIIRGVIIEKLFPLRWKARLIREIYNNFREKIENLKEEASLNIDDFPEDQKYEIMREHCFYLLEEFSRLKGELIYFKAFLEFVGRKELFLKCRPEIEILQIKVNQCQNFLNKLSLLLQLECIKHLFKI